ncbi:MAG: Ldh family oxidoreductase [Dehalococcoidia bacterium]
MAEETIVRAEALRRFTAQVFEGLGLPAQDAELVAEMLVDADLRGVDTHGVMRIPAYVRALKESVYNPRPNIQLVKESAIHALFDGDAGMGYVVGAAAMRWCIDHAREQGFAMAGVRNSTHFGAAAHYSMMAARQDLIGFACTSAPPTIAPPGSYRSTHGNNPISYAIPASQEPMLVLDMATSVRAMGRVANYRREGWPLPPGWALDKEGNPTQDADTVASLVALGEGGYKGYGLTLVMDILAGVLTGASFGGRFVAGRPAADVGHFFMALDEFKQRVDETLREAKTAPRKPGVQRLYVAGEPEFENKERRLREGIPLPPVLHRQLEALGQEMGVSLEV